MILYINTYPISHYPFTNLNINSHCTGIILPMCGITGFIDLKASTKASELRNIVAIMASTLKHRGPDDSNEWVDEVNGVALGFRRLAILDLSPSGRQPMLSANKRYVILHNGEIYNHLEIREQLIPLGHRYIGTSDTETMLSAISEWGLHNAILKFNGMFAFILWDRQENQLSLVRDRIGIKPLYYGLCGDIFLFGSELKALRQHPTFKPEIDRDILPLYLRFNYIPSPFSIYKDIRKLLPGSILSIKLRGKNTEPSLETYWSGIDVAINAKNKEFTDNEEDIIKNLETLLLDSVNQRMLSDVPLGAFLSGGVDSSLIVSLMQAQSTAPIKTFTIGLGEPGFDESAYAQAVAQHLGTDHTELYVSNKVAQDVIPKLPTLYDEPFSDVSQIPTFLVSELTRQHVTVSLSGDGGDELFGGYNRYTWVNKIWRKTKWLPSRALGMISTILKSTPAYGLQRIIDGLPRQFRIPNFSDKINKLNEVIPSVSPEEIFQKIVSHWHHPEAIVSDSQEPNTLLLDTDHWPNLSNFSEKLMLLDMLTYLPDDILVKLDRASMGTSLESRVPFLDDHRIVEFAWRLPIEYKIRNGQGKWILRQVLDNYVPRHLIDRPKMGFGVPVDRWLRGPLKDWAEDLLSEENLRREGYFNPRPIRQRWGEHITGKRNWHYSLWDILLFQAWRQEIH